MDPLSDMGPCLSDMGPCLSTKAPVGTGRVAGVFGGGSVQRWSQHCWEEWFNTLGLGRVLDPHAIGHLMTWGSGSSPPYMSLDHWDPDARVKLCGMASILSCCQPATISSEGGVSAPLRRGFLRDPMQVAWRLSGGQARGKGWGPQKWILIRCDPSTHRTHHI